ncbi:MAG: hypothetical protein GY765_06680 [bacterium]|nr:hypothetical protein [bacterium]
MEKLYQKKDVFTTEVLKNIFFLCNYLQAVRGVKQSQAELTGFNASMEGGSNYGKYPGEQGPPTLGGKPFFGMDSQGLVEEAYF